MPTLKKDQHERWEAKASNGFHFDAYRYVMWGDKTLTQYVKITDDVKVELHLAYRDERGAYGIPTGRQIPTLTVTRWTRSELGSGAFFTSSDAGWKSYAIGDVQPSKKYDTLCKIAATINAEQYVKEVA